MYVNVHNRKYWVEEQGEGPVLLMLHGFTGSTHTFDEMIKSLQDSYKILKIDLPGHARTGSIGRVTMEEFCDDLAMVLQQLKINSLSILGYSLGGRTALSFAILYPSMVDRILLESASPGLATSKDQLARQAKDEILAVKIKEGGLRAFVSFWENIGLFETQKRLPLETKKVIQQERLSHNPDGLVESLQGMGTGQQPSWWRKLSEVQVPVVLVTGEEDTKFVKINRKMQEAFSDSYLEEVHEAGHTVHIEKPKVFAKIVGDFMIL